MVKVSFIVFLQITHLISAEYDFDVFKVENCPMNEESWELASARLKCNRTHGYHCVPNKDLTSLIEFCYPKGYRFPFERGNCLELAANGILNQVPCVKTFYGGCPSQHYFSNEIFNSPKCLIINKWLRCFEADYECIYLRVLKNKTFERDIGTTKSNSVDDAINQNVHNYTDGSQTALFVVVPLFIILTIACAVLVYVIKRQRGHVNQLEVYHSVQDEGNMNLRKNIPADFEFSDDDNDSALGDENCLLDLKEDKVTKNEALKKLHELIIHGNEQQFEHFCSEIDNISLEKLDERGFNSLHLSAKNGNFKIFQSVLNLGVEIGTPTSDKRNVLHIAAFYGNYSICKYILNKHKNLYTVIDRYNMNPAHWAALAGEESILRLMFEFDCNLSERTIKYEENIVLFACIGGSYDVCSYVGSNDKISHLLHAKNSEGWNSIQYAAKSGIINVFKYLVEKGVDIKNRSKQTGKNCLHTACEKGNIEICKYILKERKESTLITQVDKHEQHVGHFAAKSGNTDILSLLIDHLSDTALSKPALLENATTDNINILHIACRHARFNMCVKIADTFPNLISEITERGWNAALFITEKAGAESERIRILNFLVNRDLNVYHVTRSGKTILYNACVNRSAKLVRYLLDKYPALLDIEKSMDPRKAANSQDIENVFKKYLDVKLQN